MLLCEDVYQLLLDELRVDERGLSCEVDEFNRLARLVNQEIYTDKIRKFEEDIENIDALGELKIHNYDIPLITGVGTLPTDYSRIIGSPRTLDGDSVTRYADLVTAFEHGAREEDYLTKATLTYPTFMIGGVNADSHMQIRVTPSTITDIWIDYIKELSVPFLDYYINDTTLVYGFFSETGDLQSVPVGSTYRDGTAGTGVATITSLTNNFDWGEDELSLLITKLVNRVAKQLPDELLLQASNREQDKSDAQ